MKRRNKHIYRNILILVILILFCSKATSQNRIITTTENAILYNLYKNEPIIVEHDSNTARQLISLDNRNKKIAKKSIEVEVIAAKTSKAQLYYDIYIVKYKNNYYYLPIEFSKSNEYIDSLNNELEDKYSNLLHLKDSLNNEYNKLILQHKDSFQKRLDFYKEQTNILPNIIESVEEKAVENYKTTKEKEFEVSYNKWYNKQSSSTKKVLKAISIDVAELGSPNSAGGCDYRLYYTNKSNKTIKYLYWDGWVYNAVNDVVYCEIRNSGYVSGKDTGPVESGEEGGGSWDCVIYNYSAEYLKLSSIDIQYMDNSRISITADDLRKIQSEPKKESISWHDTDSIKKNASRSYKRDLERYNDSISVLKNRLWHLQNEKFTMKNSRNDLEFEKLCDTIQLIKEETSKLKAEIELFKINNFLNEKRNVLTIKESQTISKKYKENKELNKKIAFGTGADILLSGNYWGATLPLEITFGSINQYINFSVSGEYTYLQNFGNIHINKLGAFANLHINIGQDRKLKFPLSFGIGYSRNLSKNVYNVSGTYYTENFNKKQFSYPIPINKSNISSIIAWSTRTRHWKFSIFARIDITPIFDKSFKDSSIPEHEDLYYDDVYMMDIMEISDKLPLFGVGVRYYF